MVDLMKNNLSNHAVSAINLQTEKFFLVRNKSMHATSVIKSLHEIHHSNYSKFFDDPDNDIVCARHARFVEGESVGFTWSLTFGTGEYFLM